MGSHATLEITGRRKRSKHLDCTLATGVYVHFSY